MKNLKWILLLIVLSLVIISCDLFGPQLAPPSWIIGTWSDDVDINTWTFISDNAIFSAPGISIDFKVCGQESGIEVSDAASTINYTIYLSEQGTDSSYIFEKLSNVTLDYTVKVWGIAVGPLVLYRQ